MRQHSPFAEGEQQVRGAVVRAASPLAAAQARGAGEHASSQSSGASTVRSAALSHPLSICQSVSWSFPGVVQLCLTSLPHREAAAEFRQGRLLPLICSQPCQFPAWHPE